MRQQHIYPPLLIGIFVAAALVASWSAAQYGSGGYGNVPQGPGAPGGPGSINQPIVRLPPTQPPATSRPSSWPGGPTGEAPSQAPPAGGLPPGELTACNGSRIVAYVGSEVILESDLILRSIDKKGTFEIKGSVDYVLGQYREQYSPDQLNAQREMLIAKLLPEVVEIKLIYLDAKETIPSEHWPDVEKQLSQGFEEIQLEKTMKQFGVTSPRELDPKLRAVGTSMEREKRAFIEFVLARQWQGQQIKHDEEITLVQMDAYYRQHLDEFTRPARRGTKSCWPASRSTALRRPPGKRSRKWEIKCAPGRRLPKWRAPAPAVGATGPPKGVWCRNSTGHCSACPSDNSAPSSRARPAFTLFA